MPPKSTYVSDVLAMPEGKEVELTGWVRNKRLHGGLIFLDLRDSTGVMQVAVRKGSADDESLSAAERVLDESSITVYGVLKRDPRAPGGAEIHCKKLVVNSMSLEEFPIKRGIGTGFLFDKRHLHLRSPRVTNIMRIKSAFLDELRKWFLSNAFFEICCPTFVTAAVEGGATLFPVDYFGRKVYMTQSVQFYQEAAIYALEKVFSVQPSFRAEMSRTRRHLTEYVHLEAEMANHSLEDMQVVIEQLIGEVTRRLAERCASELSRLQRVINLGTTEPPYERITYDEALGLLRSKGIDVQWGSDLGGDEERSLSLLFEKPFFVTHYPVEARAFYHLRDSPNPRVLRCSDLMAPGGYGEVVGGGQRIHSYDELKRIIVEAGLDPSEYEWYLDLRKFGSVPHSGFGLGVERVLMWLLGLSNIRSVSLFPRTPSRVRP